ncbi:unnamed protein product, partial [Oppiella nova]
PHLLRHAVIPRDITAVSSISLYTGLPVVAREYGRHFGAITCESCKAFFRRNANKDKLLECPSDGKCKINANTRKLCQKCRLNKCLAVGMKKTTRYISLTHPYNLVESNEKGNIRGQFG